MTPALKAMVEAMIAELGNQAVNAPTPLVTFLPDAPKVELRGTFNLEAVARAGLEAIKPALCNPSDDLRDAYSEAEEMGDHPVEHHVNGTRIGAMIDAILKEQA